MPIHTGRVGEPSVDLITTCHPRPRFSLYSCIIETYEAMVGMVWTQAAAARNATGSSAGLRKNVGSEVNGKSDLFSRPVVILKKLSHSFYFVVPTTTQPREGTWYVPFSLGGKEMIACLHQARALDYRRLSSRLGTIDGDDFSRVRSGFRALYKLDQ